MSSPKNEYTLAEMDPERILPRHLHFRDTTCWKKDVHTMSILLEKFQEDPPGRRTSDVFRQNPRIRPCSAIPREQRTHFRHWLINTHNIHDYNYSVTGYGAQTRVTWAVTTSEVQCDATFRGGNTGEA